MKIATWNLERGGRTQAAREAQCRTLEELGADVVVLTEPGRSYVAKAGCVTSPPERPGGDGSEPWVAIVGLGVERVPIAIPYGRMAAAVHISIEGRGAIVYGAVLPWLKVTSDAPELVAPGEDSGAAFQRVLREQAVDVAELRRTYGVPVIWAGDFNQSVEGPLWGGAGARRAALFQVLGDLGFGAWNGSAAHAKDGMCAVDLICGPLDLVPRGHGRIAPERRGVTMTDHAGYWLDL